MEKDVIKAEFENVLITAETALDFRDPEQREMKTKIGELMTQLQKPWAIRALGDSTDPVVSQTEVTGTLTVALEWKQATVKWLAACATFCAKKLPPMNVPGGRNSSGIYKSSDEYFDVIIRIWVGMTFGEGNDALSPRCFCQARNGPCGKSLWPLVSGHFTCGNCHQKAAEFSCPNRQHNYGLCQTCHGRYQQALRGPPGGKRSSTNIYDGTVRAKGFDGTVFIVDFQSRKPPEKKIHWKSSSRLSTSNLVGIVKLSEFGACLQPSDEIFWAEVVAHDKTKPREEHLRRQDNRLAINLLNIDDIDRGHLDPGSHVAIIDCKTFAPEHVPVLKALEIQKASSLPFKEGALLNLVADHHCFELAEILNPDDVSAETDASATTGEPAATTAEVSLAESEPDPKSAPELEKQRQIRPNLSDLELRLSRAIDESRLEPVIMIRKSEYREDLITQLSQLVRKSHPDLGQLDGFIESLVHPVHCVQGPPGTGKSFVGVVICKAMLIIRKYWLEVCPSEGSPPILVLSYKNHAIDEFLIDLLKGNRGVDLIRIGGGSKDPILAPYTERRAMYQDYDVQAHRQKVAYLHGCLQNLRSLPDCHNALLLSQLDVDTMKSEEEQRCKTKIDFKGAEACRDIIIRLQVLMETSKSRLNFDDDSSFKKTDVEIELDTDTVLWIVGGRPIKRDSPDDLIPGLFGEFSNRTYRLDVCDVLLHFMQGASPPPRCIFVDWQGKRCTNECDRNTSICRWHRCQFTGGCSSAIVSGAGKWYCEAHACCVDDCKVEKLVDPQIYCCVHACSVCVKDGLQAKIALDDPPRNTCSQHKLCTGSTREHSLCNNLALEGTRFCREHEKVPCQGVTKKGAPCGSFLGATKDVPFCAGHRSQAPKISSSSTNKDTSKCQAKTSKGKPCKGTAIEGQRFCMDHIEKQVEWQPTKASWAKAEKPIEVADDVQESEPNVDVQDVELTEMEHSETHEKETSEQPDDIDLDDTSSNPADVVAVDEVETGAANNIDEQEEPEHLRHLMEVHEIEEEDEVLVEIAEDLDTLNITEIVDDELEWTSPANWSWEMSLKKRWQVCQQLMNMDSFFLQLIEQQLKKEAQEARVKFHEAEVAARSSAYEGKQVIGGTIVGCITKLEAIRATKPFAIIVEEASEVMEPLLFACLGPTTQKLEMLGDHLQLQPSCSNKFEFEILNKVNISMFERLLKAPSSHRVPCDVLSVQRRMRKNICDLTREFYSEITEIVDHPCCHTKRIENGRCKRCATEGREVPGVFPHLFWWTHDGRQSPATVGLSRVNVKEANMVCHLANYLVSCGVPKQSIAILTPYKGQLMLIRNQLLKDGLLPQPAVGPPPPKAYCIASTVDRFQGDEADVVIISMVLDSQSRTQFVKKVNRMIVLLSRARIGMYIVGNVSYFQTESKGEMQSFKHWTDTFEKLKLPAASDSRRAIEVYQDPRIGHSLPICCPLHRVESRKLIQEPGELKPRFCEVPCDYKLPCSHPCGLSCHFPNSNHNAKCLEEIDSPCERHPRTLLCHNLTKVQDIRTALACYSCDFPVDLKLPCGHSLKMSCSEEVAISQKVKPWPKCTQPAFEPYVYEGCKHTRECKCAELDEYKNSTKKVLPCEKDTEYTPACSHVIHLKCWQRQMYVSMPSSFRCNKQLDITLPRCGHLAKVPCSRVEVLKSWSGKPCCGKVVVEGTEYGDIDHHCETEMIFVRRCGHKMRLPCHKAFEYAEMPIPCNEVEEMVNPLCGHPLLAKCHQKLGILKRLPIRSTPSSPKLEKS